MRAVSGPYEQPKRTEYGYFSLVKPKTRNATGWLLSFRLKGDSKAPSHRLVMARLDTSMRVPSRLVPLQVWHGEG